MKLSTISGSLIDHLRKNNDSPSGHSSTCTCQLEAGKYLKKGLPKYKKIPVI